MKKYQIRAHETGHVIDEYDTLDAAETALESYIADDRANGEYTPRYHEIYDSHTEKIITVA